MIYNISGEVIGIDNDTLDTAKTELTTSVSTVQTNLDTAKSDLDGKIETVKKTYLPLSGGTLTGKLTAPAIIAPVVGSWNGVAAFWHNIPRAEPKDITSYVADGSLWNRIAGTNGYSLFEDIYVGDYIKMSRPISAYEQTGQYQTTGSQYVTVAGIDTHMNVGDRPTDGSPTNISYHHLDMVPGQGFGGTQHFGRSRMNSTNTTEGGYVGSEIFKTTIGSVATSGSTASTASINQQLYAEFGSHLKTHRALLSNSLNKTGYNRYGTNTGCTSSWAWTNVQAVLMTEIEVYGSISWASSGYDIGCGKQQMPLFAANVKAMNNATAWYWLRSVASASEFCRCTGYGFASYLGADNADACVRPRFIIA